MSSRSHCISKMALTDFYTDVSPPPRGTTRLHRAVDAICAEYQLEVTALAEFHMSRIYRILGMGELGVQARRARLGNSLNDPRRMT